MIALRQHRVQLVDADQREKLFGEMGELWSSYVAAAAHYFQIISSKARYRGCPTVTRI